ncbi:MAG: GNAT family protein [Pseudomonadota bacterium]
MLIGPLCTLRPLQRSDMEVSLSWRRDVSTRSQVDGYPFPITEEMESGWFDAALSDPKSRSARFAIELTESAETAVGFIHLTDIDSIVGAATFGMVLGDPKVRGRGIGSEAMGLLIDYAFGTLNLRRISLVVKDDNAAARALYAKMGFAEEGRLKQAAYADGKYIDLIAMALLRDPA